MTRYHRDFIDVIPDEPCSVDLTRAPGFCEALGLPNAMNSIDRRLAKLQGKPVPSRPTVKHYDPDDWEKPRSTLNFDRELTAP